MKSQQGLLAPCDTFDPWVRWEGVRLGSESSSVVAAGVWKAGSWKSGIQQILRMESTEYNIHSAKNLRRILISGKKTLLIVVRAISNTMVGAIRMHFLICT